MFTLRQADGSLLSCFVCNHALTARKRAVALAIDGKMTVEVLRDGKVSYVVLPDGSTHPPPGAQVPPRAACTRGTGRACFCTPCREERKAARA